jgi:hypothetical protein
MLDDFGMKVLHGANLREGSSTQGHARAAPTHGDAVRARRSVVHVRDQPETLCRLGSSGAFYAKRDCFGLPNMLGSRTLEGSAAGVRCVTYGTNGLLERCSRHFISWSFE